MTFSSTLLWSGVPGDIVRNVIHKDISLKGERITMELRQKTWEDISTAFNFEEMAKRAMKDHWGKRSPGERKEFVGLFANNLKDSYIRKTDSRFGEEIISLKEKQRDKYAKVQVELSKRTEKEISADFLLIRKKGKWKIYDVIIEGVSVIMNYRRQINSFLDKYPYEELVETLK